MSAKIDKKEYMDMVRKEQSVDAITKSARPAFRTLNSDEQELDDIRLRTSGNLNNI